MPTRGTTVQTTPTGPARVGVTAGIDEEKARAAAEALARELALPLLDLRHRGQSCGPPQAETEPGAQATGQDPRAGAWGSERCGTFAYAHFGDSADERFDLLLVVGAHRLELWETGRGGTGPIFVDLVGGAVGYRRRSSRDRRQPLALAVALRDGPCTVVDATAGLARDAFLLAGLGCTVIAVERSEVLGALIRDGLQRGQAQGDAALQTVLNRMKLVVAEAREVLAGMTGSAAPDVVYLDPMYPPRRKSALAKKEMRICRRLVGDDPDAGELLEAARLAARKRVVVKRHHRAPPLAPRPVMQHIGKEVRYDVYHPYDPQR